MSAAAGGGAKADGLADELRRRILARELVPGTMLPTERVLATDSGLGRSSVREALRKLEAQGLVRVRPGRAGGAEVVAPTSTSLADSVAVFIQGAGLRTRSVVEAREALEPACAALAARRRTPEDLDALRASDARMAAAAASHDDAYLQANVDWHVGVAAASHNELLAGFMAAISDAVRDATDVRSLDSPQVREAAVAAHAGILAAIGDGDAATARRRMDRHVRAYADVLSMRGLEEPPNRAADDRDGR